MKTKHLLFSVLTLLMAGAIQVWADEALYQTIFNSSNNSSGITSYTATWTNTTDGFQTTIANGNNNNNGWEYVKFGRKGNASVGTITTANPMEEVLDRVTVTIDAVTASSINGIKLLTSSDGTTFTERASFTIAKGSQTATIPENVRQANLYYQIQFDCASGSANGLVQVSKVEYFEHVYVPPTPTATLTADADSINKGDTVHFSYTTENTESHELVDLNYRLSSATEWTTVTEPEIAFLGSTGTYSVYARIRVDDNKVINSDTVAVYVKPQTTSATISATDWATAQELEIGDSPEPLTKDGVTFAFNAGTGSAVTYASGGYFNMRAGNMLSFSVPEGYVITVIHLYTNVYSQKTYLVNGTWSSGTATATTSTTDKQVIWTGSAQDVSVTVNNVVAITSLRVYYTDINQNYFVSFYDADRNLIETQKVRFGSTVNPPTPPTVPDKNFIGWRSGSATSTTILTPTEIAATAVRADVSYYAAYEYDASVLNETTTITAYEVLVDNGTTSWGGFTFESLDFTKNDKSVFFNKGTSSNMYWNKSNSDAYFSFTKGNTIRIRSNNMMHKVTFTFSSTISSTYSSVTSGKLSVSGNQMIWEGSSSDFTVTCTTSPSGSFYLKTITILSDTNKTTATVTFVGIDGQIIQQQEVALNAKVTAPALPAHSETGMQYVWNKTIARATEDVTYTMKEEPIIHLDATSEYLSNNAVSASDGYSYSLTQNRAQIFFKGSTYNYSDGLMVDSVKVVSTVDEPIRRIMINGKLSRWKASTGVFDGTLWYGVANEVTFKRSESGIYYLSSIQVLSTPHYVTVDFRDAEGRQITTQEVEVGKPTTSPAVPEIEDMKQTGWMIDTTFVSLEDFAVMPIMDNMLCVAKYEYHTFTVTFLDPDGNLITTQKVAKGESPISPEFTLPEGTALAGWLINGELVSIEEFEAMPITDFLTCTAQYTIAEGYHTVTFVDRKGNTIESLYIEDNHFATPPTAPTVDNFRFVGWQAEGSSIVLSAEQITTIPVTADITYTAAYELDLEHATPITVVQANTICSQLSPNTQSEDMYLVKGAVYQKNSSIVYINEDRTISFYMKSYGGKEMYVTNVTGPVVVKSDLQEGDTVIVYAYLYRNGSENTMRDGSVEAIINNRNYFPSATADLLYDFNGDGIKEYIDKETDSYAYFLKERNSMGKYISKKILFNYDYSSKDYELKFLQDINGDGQPDITLWNNDYLPYNRTMVSDEDGYTRYDSMTVITNFDINRDGRQDYIFINQKQAISSSSTINYGSIGYQQPDGSFHSELMRVMTWSEFVAQATSEELDQINNPQNYSLGDVSRYTYTFGLSDLSGAALARAPKRVSPRRAQSVGYTLPAPSKAIDMNGDGLADLIDEKNGVIYTNMGNGKWVMTATNGIVIPADLNGDGITDFIFPGTKLYVSVYSKTTNAFTTTTLYTNAAVDDIVYAQDFDRDGDIDLLATFTAVNNTTKTAYTCFFKNDGNGTFTRQAEQSYGTNNLLFGNMQDIDGDGYYDLLAFRGSNISTSSSLGYKYYNIPDSSQVVWLQGQANLRFAQPDSLFVIPKGLRTEVTALSCLQAEDLDNDGKIDIWLSGVGTTAAAMLPQHYSYPSAQVNAAPTAPVAPALQYNEGVLTITWGDGSDDHTMPCDLTYALRIGTSSGAMDILRPHANADGSRRNFLDGHAGRAHSYTIDLNSYAPGDIYVAVQAIDAQHAGSAWSAEATIRHEKLSADFTLNSTLLRLNEKLLITFTPMSEGYVHEWSVTDGVTDSISASQREVTFPVGGLKTITHTITAPDGREASASQIVRVLPAGVTPLETVVNRYFLNQPTADFNYDGRADVLGNKAVLVGTTTGDMSQQAEGLWNTNFLTSGWRVTGNQWYDYNRDGHADLLLQEEYGSSNKLYSYLPHAADANTLSDRVDDDNVAYLFGYNEKEGNTTVGTYYNLAQDFTHNGRYDVFYGSADGYQLMVEQEDGSYLAQSVSSIIGDYVSSAKNNGFMADFDHDGFVDMAQMSGSALKIAYSRGEGNFEMKTIPFAQSVQWSDGDVYLADFNGDGYIDICLNLGSTRTLHMMWNNRNLSFSAPEELPSEELRERYMDNTRSANPCFVRDIDANGYPDILFAGQNVKYPNSGNSAYPYRVGLYVWFMGASGIENYGWLMDNQSAYTTTYLSGNEQYFTSESSYRIYNLADTAPAIPTDLTATATDEGLLITWTPAVDDHTPAALMRYNLSIRLQGSSTYIISPLNGGNNGTMPLSDYTYINATQFLIPTSALSSSVYEIKIQALDMQQHFSDFTPALTVTYSRTNPVEAVTQACALTDVLISYRGETSASEPIWDFDGGTIVSGSGYGPYTVHWGSAGQKTIAVTVDGMTYTHTITIDNPYDMAVTLPTMLLMEHPATATIPAEVIRYEWYVQIGNDERRQILSNGIYMDAYGRTIRDKRLTVDGLQITAHEVPDKTSLTQEDVVIYLYVVNSNGCDAWFYSPITVIANTTLPAISLVTVDANAQNVIHFEADATNFPSVRILKETNVLNQFAEIAVVPAEQGVYTDTQSDAAQQPDRYKVQGIMVNGSYSNESEAHKTVHATINRGVQEGTYNLIWNAYEGADVVTYNILRGSSVSALAQIGSVAASATSYTDQAPLDAEPYYVVEYVLSGTSAAAPAHRAPAAVKTALIGRSNIVDRNNTQQPPVTECNDINVTWLQTGGSGLGEMTTDDASIWKYDAQYGAKATKQGGYTGHLMTPAKDLSGMESVTLSFQHTHKFAGTPANELTLWVTADYKGSYAASTWQQLTISPYAANTNWTFVSVTINVPVSMVGANTVFAFRYMSTASAYATWEIKDLHFVAECAGAVPPEQDPITVRLYPISENIQSNVYLYAWTGNGTTQPCGAWPGTAVAKDTEGWWSYTFDKSIQDVNIIWNGNGYQTVDIIGVTSSTCYRLDESVYPFAADVIDCDTPITEGIEDIRTDASSAPRKIMIDNIIYILRGEKIYTVTGQEVK